MNYFIYTSHHFTPHGKYELNKEHRTGIAEVTGWIPIEALIFFRLLLFFSFLCFSSCLNWKIEIVFT